MTTQTISPDSLNAADWQQIFSRSPLGEDLQGDDLGEDETQRTVRETATIVRSTDSDDRLDCLSSLNPGLTTEHLEEIAGATGRWLDGPARERLRKAAIHTYESTRDPGRTMEDWTTQEEIGRLTGLLQETSVPDVTLAICYAMSAACDAAAAAFFIHQVHTESQTDFGEVRQTPEEIAEDLRFVNSQQEDPKCRLRSEGAYTGMTSAPAWATSSPATGRSSSSATPSSTAT